MISCVSRGSVDGCWGGGALRVGAAVGESDELGKGIGTVGTFEEGGVPSLLRAVGYVGGKMGSP